MRRLKEIENRGHAESATIEQLCKINTTIDSCKERLDFIETAAQRPEVNTDLNKNFTDYIRKGIMNSLSQKTLSGDSNNSGGYFITPHIMKRIYKNVVDASPMRQICSSQKISTETLDCIIETERADAGWSGTNDFTKDTGTPKIIKVSITTYELYAQPQISQRLLDDAFVDVESWLVEKIVETFTAKENEAFIKGDGSFNLKEFWLMKMIK